MASVKEALKILVVDDDRSTRMLLKAFLAKAGHTTVEAANGQEAIQVFEEQQPNLILMDVNMPVMTGYEAASLIKSRVGNRFLPIIFLTGLNDDESLAKCVENGGDDFLVKPFNSVLLGAKIVAMQRIRGLHRELEQYQQHTEEEIALSHHVFDSLTKRTGSKVIPGLDQWMHSAGHFSGDLLIHAVSPAGKLYLMLNDFTGHGFSAAIGALPVADVFFAMTRRDFNTRDIVLELNRKLREILPVGHFCATGLICCDPNNRNVEIFNAGLPPILLLDSNGKIESQVKSTSLALGILESKDFNPETLVVNGIQGSTWVIYSDGVTEARNAAGEIFGNLRLENTLESAPPLNKPLAAVKVAVEEFIGNIAPDDDISMVTLKC